MPGTNTILAVVTNVGEYETVGYRTGLWLGELTHFMDAVEPGGFRCDIASPAGGYVPIDPESLMLQEIGHAVGLGGPVHRHYEDRAFMDQLKNTMTVADADTGQYDAIYLTGGHGVCFDFPKSRALADLTARFYEAGKVVSAVCHGPAGLLEVKVGGEYLINGKDVTGFSHREEELAKRDKAVPYILEEELKKRGAKYGKSSIPFKSHVVEDGLLITGQNPASASAVGEAVVKRLRGGR
jgi:putative intracellular protease/amidase